MSHIVGRFLLRVAPRFEAVVNDPRRQLLGSRLGEGAVLAIQSLLESLARLFVAALRRTHDADDFLPVQDLTYEDRCSRRPLVGRSNLCQRWFATDILRNCLARQRQDLLNNRNAGLESP